MDRGPYEVMDLKALRCFWAIGKYGSLTRAGIELGIAQPAVSQRIKSLEQYLGIKLYEAPGGKVRLTRAGKHAFEVATKLFDELTDFERTVTEEDVGGTLSLSSHEPILRYFLPGIIRQFCERFPFTHLKLLSRLFEESIEMVRANDVDLGIVPRHRLAGEVVFHPLQTYRAYVLMRRGHPLARRGPPEIESLLTEETLNRYPLIVAETDDPEHGPIRKVLTNQGLPYNVAVEAGTFETLKHYVAEGFGLSVVSGLCLVPEDNKALIAIEVPKKLWKGTTYGVIRRADKHLTKPLKHLLSLLGVPASNTGK